MSTLFEKCRKILEKLTDSFWRASCDYIKYYDRLPIDEHMILLESEHGKKMDGNIFYMLQYMAQNPDYSAYKIYLSAMGCYKREFEDFLKRHGIENVNIVMLASDEYMRILTSAKYLINDTSFAPYFIKKKGQIYLNTWHGTPLKTLGRSDKTEYSMLGNIQKNFVMSDYLLYPNEYTMQHITRDYMLRNISRGKYILSGYPRNVIFFDKSMRDRVRDEMRLGTARIYAYMPTYRGSYRSKGDQRNTVYLAYYLYELDAGLTDEEVLYVNLHPLAQKDIDFQGFKHIRTFPPQYETYEFLNAADVLVTDYSSVMFDYAVTGRKIVLFTYDEREYIASRGTYMAMDELPFERAYDALSLLEKLRDEKNYNDSQFLKRFAVYDSPDASKNLCDAVVLGDMHMVHTGSIPDNGKENVLIYTGNLALNGITTSLLSLLDTADLDKCNYYLTFISERISKNRANLLKFPQDVSYFAATGDMDLAIRDRLIRKLFRQHWLSADAYMRLCKRRVMQDFERCYGGTRIDAVIQFNGYEQDQILKFSTFSGKKTIFVHSDMMREIATRQNQRLDVLRYAYRRYDRVAVVNSFLKKQAAEIAGRDEHIVLVRNTVDFQKILEQSHREPELDDETRVYPSREHLLRALSSQGTKFINVGRFSPEKGHERLINAFCRYRQENPDDYLIIMGGDSINKGYETTIAHIECLGLDDRVILLLNVSNPYPIINACDAFVLSSFYEGFGLVLAEADVLGKPVVSTAIDGPSDLLKNGGGTMVEDSEDGILEGLYMLKAGTAEKMNVNWAAYNEGALREFEQIL